MDIRCDTCRFGRLANPTTIECRRYAPRPVPVDTKMAMPTMGLDFWCGEHEPKGAAARATRKGQH